MLKMTSWFAISTLAIFLCGCGDRDDKAHNLFERDYATTFKGKPTVVITPSKLNGVWERLQNPENIVVRVEISSDQIVVNQRCKDLKIVAIGGANLKHDEVKKILYLSNDINTSKTKGSETCRLEVKDSEPNEGKGLMRYLLADNQLELRSSNSLSGSYKKLSD